MAHRIRAGLLFAAVAMVVLALLSACSSRESTDNSKRVVDRSAQPSAVAAGSGSNGGGAHGAGRGPCQPAGVIGVANPSSPGEFLATFDGQPTGPAAVCGAADWDIQIHSRNADTWLSLDPMDAQHGPNCAGPPATHATRGDPAEAVFMCRDHVMTSIRGDGYAAVYLTPNQLVDLSQGPVIIRFDVSTERMSTRDWIDVWLTPWNDNLALPLEEFEVDLQGPPRNSLQISTTASQNAPILVQTHDGVSKRFQEPWEISSLNDGIASGTNEAAARQPFQLTLTKTSAKFERLESPTASPLVFWQETVNFPFDAAVLQFGHHSYTPMKDGAGDPGTWHWDNIGISHAIPFSLTRANEYYADPEAPAVTFGNSSSDGAMLRFAAIGRVEVSFDGGQSWTAASRADGMSQAQGNHHPEHFSSYWTPMPAGVDQVQFRFGPDDWYQGPFFAQGISIWSR